MQIKIANKYFFYVNSIEFLLLTVLIGAKITTHDINIKLRILNQKQEYSKLKKVIESIAAYLHDIVQTHVIRTKITIPREK